MNRKQARRLLIAAGDNAVVAAWAHVLDEHKAAAPTDVSPYEAWDALQGLCDAGVVTTQEFDALQGAFFDNLPPKDKLEAALTNLRILPDVDALEEITGSMFKKSKESQELQVAEPVQTKLAPPSRTPLSKPMTRPAMSRPPTSPPPGVPGSSKPSLSFGKPQGSSLPCRDDGVLEIRDGGRVLRLVAETTCIVADCGGTVKLYDGGPVDIAEADIAGITQSGEVRIWNRLIGRGPCDRCKRPEMGMLGEVQDPL